MDGTNSGGMVEGTIDGPSGMVVWKLGIAMSRYDFLSDSG